MLDHTPKHRILNIAHRGARSLAPENTLAAARKAFEVGADMWELDIGMTADGELILVHDDTLVRTSNAADVFPSRRPWFVRDFTLEEIHRLDFGAWFVKQDPFRRIQAGEVSASEAEGYIGEPAPTLEEALRFTLDHDWLVNVEIKDLKGSGDSRSVLEKVAAVIDGFGLIDRVLVSSFNHTYLRRLKAINPKIATGALVRMRHRNPSALLGRLGAISYHPHTGAIRFKDVVRLRNAGFSVFVWVVNEVETMKAFIDSEVSGLFTDFPQSLGRILKLSEGQ